MCLPSQAAAARSTACKLHCSQNRDKTTLTYKSLLGHFYSKMPCYFLQLMFLCKNNKTQLLLQAPRKITEPWYSIRQLPCPARTGHTLMFPGSSFTSAGDPGSKKGDV